MGCNGPASGGPTVSSVPPGHRRLIGEWAMEMDHRDFLPLRFRRLQAFSPSFNAVNQSASRR